MNILNINISEILNIGKEIFSYGLIIFIISILILFIVLGILNKYIDKVIIKIKNKKKTDNNRSNQSNDTTLDFISKIIKAIVKAIIILLILTQIKMLTSLGAAVMGATGVFALVIGFAAQESASTLIGGFFLSYYKPFVIGDLVYLPGKDLAGRVVEVGLRHTVILTINNSKIIIPNNIMNTEVIENRDEDHYYTNIFIYSISYDSDYKLAKKLLNDMVISNPLAIKEGLDISISLLNSSSIDIKVIVRTKDLPQGITLHTQLNEQVLDTFKENNIEIPYNTQTINIKK